MSYTSPRELENARILNGHRADRCPARIDISLMGDEEEWRFMHGKCGPKPAVARADESDHRNTLYNLNREASTVVDMTEHRAAYPNCPMCKVDRRKAAEKEALDAAEEANRQADAEAEPLELSDFTSIIHVLPTDVLVFTGVGQGAVPPDLKAVARAFGVREVLLFSEDAAITVIRKAVDGLD